MVKSICGCEDGGWACREDTMTRGLYVRHIHEAVKRARDDERSVPVEMHGSHIVDMSVQRFSASPCIA